LILREIIASDIQLPKEQLLDETSQKLRKSVPLKQRSRIGYHGLPQGASISPFLANVALEDTLFLMNPRFVQYADDGLFYGDNPINLKPNHKMKVANIELNESKSH
jgi:hypothetical protein